MLAVLFHDPRTGAVAYMGLFDPADLRWMIESFEEDGVEPYHWQAHTLH